MELDPAGVPVEGVLVGLIEGLEERVVGALVADVCDRAMTRDHLNVAVEYHDFFHQGHDQLVIIPSGHVGAAYAAGKKGVSGEQNPVMLRKIAHASRGVAWGRQDLQCRLPELDRISVIHVHGLKAGIRSFHAEVLGKLGADLHHLLVGI